MSYITRVIGTREIVQQDRLIVVDAGNPAPEPVPGYTILFVSAVGNKDVYIEYKVVEGPIS